MASTINAAASPTSGVITTADNSGILQLQGNGVTGLTVNSNGALGVGPSASYGTSGKVMVSQGSGSPAIWGEANLTSAVTGTLPIGNGGTGATTAQGALANLGGTSVGKSIAMSMIFGF